MTCSLVDCESVIDSLWIFIYQFQFTKRRKKKTSRIAARFGINNGGRNHERLTIWKIKITLEIERNLFSTALKALFFKEERE